MGSGSRHSENSLVFIRRGRYLPMRGDVKRLRGELKWLAARIPARPRLHWPLAGL